MEMKSNLLNMALCLSLVCLVCSGLLGGVYALTAEPIARTNAEILKASIAQVLPEGGEISDAMPLEVGGQPSEYYVSRDGENVLAYAVKVIDKLIKHVVDPRIPRVPDKTPHRRFVPVNRLHIRTDPSSFSSDLSTSLSYTASTGQGRQS